MSGAIVFTATGSEQPENVSDGWTFYANTTKTLFDVIFDNTVPSGSRVWIKVAWFNPTSQLGPFSRVATAFIAGVGKASTAKPSVEQPTMRIVSEQAA